MTLTPPPTDSGRDPISPEQARAALDAAMAERLGDNWADEDSFWVLVTGHDYMARVNGFGKNIDFYVDLLGNVTIEEKPLDPTQSSGRTIAWVILILALGIAYLFARAVGWL
ncbi:MAG: hypothetical protein KME04_09005 [Pleurocapsa minor GSE-CHR-MK-17-07R]|jgi:hypothetical protein|nr:hypothetical protein [Pleurocapsa minor GSE-CHR-MK 17-07R]